MYKKYDIPSVSVYDDEGIELRKIRILEVLKMSGKIYMIKDETMNWLL